MNNPDPALKEALDLIGRERLIQFFRLARQPGCVKAIEFINEDLDEGRSLEEIFAKEPTPTPHAGGPYIHAIRMGKAPSSFRISFGYSFADCGDGGQWTYSFEKETTPEVVEEGPRVIH